MAVNVSTLTQHADDSACDADREWCDLVPYALQYRVAVSSVSRVGSLNDTLPTTPVPTFSGSWTPVTKLSSVPSASLVVSDTTVTVTAVQWEVKSNLGTGMYWVEQGAQTVPRSYHAPISNTFSRRTFLPHGVGTFKLVRAFACGQPLTALLHGSCDCDGAFPTDVGKAWFVLRYPSPWTVLNMALYFPYGGYSDPPGFYYSERTFGPYPIGLYMASHADNPIGVDDQLIFNGAVLDIGSGYAHTLFGGATTVFHYLPAGSTFTLNVYNTGGSYGAVGQLRMYTTDPTVPIPCGNSVGLSVWFKNLTVGATYRATFYFNGCEVSGSPSCASFGTCGAPVTVTPYELVFTAEHWAEIMTDNPSDIQVASTITNLTAEAAGRNTMHPERTALTVGVNSGVNVPLVSGAYVWYDHYTLEAA